MDTDEFKQKQQAMIREFGDSMAGYIAQHADYDHWSKDDVVRETISVLATDIGAANRYINLIGLGIDIYTYEPPTKENENGSESHNDHGAQPADAGGEIHG